MENSYPHIISIPKITDPRGNLSFLQSPSVVPFEIVRAYWIYDVPSGLERDGHAYYNNEELIVALSGSIDVMVDDGQRSTTFHLRHPDQGLIVPPMHWRSLENFSTNAVALVLASTLYTPEDYILNYQEFKQLNGD